MKFKNLFKNLLHLGASVVLGPTSPATILKVILADILNSDLEKHAEDMANHGLAHGLEFGENQAQAEAHMKTIEAELKALMALKM